MIEKTEVYRVEISGTPAFDNLKAWDYDDFNQIDVTEGNINGKAEEYKKKAAAKVRFDQMCMNLQKGLNALTDLEAEGGNHTALPTSMKFTLVYTQPDGLLVETDEENYEEPEYEDKVIHDIDRYGNVVEKTIKVLKDDHDNIKDRDGRVFWKGKKAIKALIEDAAAHTYKIITNYWDPTNYPEGFSNGVRLDEITVEAIDGVTVEVKRLVPNYEAE